MRPSISTLAERQIVEAWNLVAVTRLGTSESGVNDVNTSDTFHRAMALGLQA